MTAPESISVNRYPTKCQRKAYNECWNVKPQLKLLELVLPHTVADHQQEVKGQTNVEEDTCVSKLNKECLRLASRFVPSGAIYCRWLSVLIFRDR